MSVPLDRLYNYLRDVCNHDIIIYRFFPHGSKKLADCTPLSDDFTNVELFTKMHSVFHDQEPLDFNFLPPKLAWFLHEGNKYVHPPESKFSLWKTVTLVPHMLYDNIVLVHSERRSNEVAKFEQHGVCSAYWWSHALLAQDWYRYAKYDPKLQFNPTAVSQDFLVYNRAWAGTREYRLKFAELIVNNDLVSTCSMKFAAFDSGYGFQNNHYTAYKFKNTRFAISTDLEKHFEPNLISSDASADYDSADYKSAGVEVVLETLFDDTRLHLTEKSLRPIACNKPFILAATHGSLAYLRSYGFKTFGEFWDESYDLVEDPVQRLEAIVKLMKNISALPPSQKQKLWVDCNAVCEYNRLRFFSREFFNVIVDEYKSNIHQAIEQAKSSISRTYFDQCPNTLTEQELLEINQYFKEN
jgi:hypothetical protein